MHFVYVLKNKTKYYIGFTNDLDRRMGEHEYQHHRYDLIYFEAYTNEKLARNREQKLNSTVVHGVDSGREYKQLRGRGGRFPKLVYTR